MNALGKILMFVTGATILVGSILLYLFAEIEDGKGWVLVISAITGFALMAGSDIEQIGHDTWDKDR